MTGKWTNPYINKADNWPETLINCSDDGLTTKQIEQITEKMGNYEQTCIELGSGSGGFLLTKAERDPHRLYIGFELRYKRSVRTVEKAEERGIKNILLIRSDAREIDKIFTDSSITACYINFPDPWDKKRWKKHRLVSPELLLKISKILSESGSLNFKSDHEEYYNFVQNLLDSESSFQVTETSSNLHESQFQAENLLTEFEQLFQSQNKNIYYLKAIRL